VHITWHLETQTVHRFAALPAWLAEDMTVYRGDNQDPAFIEKIRKLSSQRQAWPRQILNDEGYFSAMVTPAWLVALPTFSTTAVVPGEMSIGTTTFNCIKPAVSPGAAP